MTLYFLRHGHADHPGWTGRDDDRPLTREGIENMRLEARTMANLGIKVDVVVTSPLPRAQETAELVARGVGAGGSIAVDPRLAPGFGPGALNEILAEHRGRGDLMLVGHEPDFSHTIGELTGGRVVMKKGGLARLDSVSGEGGAWQLIWLLPPRILTL